MDKDLSRVVYRPGEVVTAPEDEGDEKRLVALGRIFSGKIFVLCLLK